MSTSVSPDVAYVLKHLDEIKGDSHKRKQDFHNHLTKEETQSQPNVEVENVDDRTFRTLVLIFNYIN
jgi:hypothetical protein